MPSAVSTFLETPRNGQSPRNWLSTTLLTSEELIININKSFTTSSIFLSFLRISLCAYILLLLLFRVRHGTRLPVHIDKAVRAAAVGAACTVRTAA